MPNYRVTVGGKEYQVEIPDLHERPIRAIVEGEEIIVQVEEGTPAMPAKTAVAPAVPPVVRPATGGGAKTVRAPLPGTILRVSVKPGDTIQFGQELCILEAMKMNNPIKATRTGKVAQVFVTQGQQVLHNEPLLAFED